MARNILDFKILPILVLVEKLGQSKYTLCDMNWFLIKSTNNCFNLIAYLDNEFILQDHTQYNVDDVCT